MRTTTLINDGRGGDRQPPAVRHGVTGVERKIHDELLDAGGFYRRIYDLELRDQEEAAAEAAIESAGRD